MFFKATLTIALILFGIGLIHRVDSWFLRNVGIGDRGIAAPRRFGAGLKGLLGVLFSTRLFSLLKALVVDVLFQARILRDRQDPLVWVMHFCLFVGFLLLLLFHALGDTFAAAVFEEYQPTLNPFLFLRNLFGLFLSGGLVLAVIRRFRRRDRIRTSGMDVYAIAILAVIVLSGFLLEGVKIPSHREFAAMVTEYGDDISEPDLPALEAYWVSRHGLVSPEAQTDRDLKADANVLLRGKELHEMNCLGCHSRPQWAFLSYPLSRLLKPVAVGLDRAGVHAALRTIHFLACFVGLACLAFSKLFHIIGTPVSLLVAALEKDIREPAAAATRQMLELDGCRHGGACHETCPVRQRRMERIAKAMPYEPMFDYLGRKSIAELGGREGSA